MSTSPEETGRRNRRRHPRHDYRARSHASAHADGEGKPAAAIPDHPLIPKSPATLISQPQELGELLDHLRQMGSFTYDSEFIGELTYHPKLCLIQVATAQRIVLIDTLSDLDIRPFWEIIADPAVEKVVHAGEQDLEPVFRALGRPPANIFDTQVAAGFAGLAYPAGLSKLVRELVGAHMGKGFTFTHWDQRPLSAVQLRYAADDVRYLPAVRSVLGNRLDELDHLAWVKDECAALCNPDRYRPNPASDYLRLRGANSLTRQSGAILRELYMWRETAALRHDSPPRSYVKDEILLDMARKPPAAVGDLPRVRGLPRPVEAEEGQNIVEAVQRALQLPDAQLPDLAQPEESPSDRFAADALWAAVQAFCHGQSIDPGLVASRQEIARLRRSRHRSSGPGSSSRLAHGWRAEMLGSLLDRFLHGRSQLHLHWDGTLRSHDSERKSAEP